MEHYSSPFFERIKTESTAEVHPIAFITLPPFKYNKKGQKACMTTRVGNTWIGSLVSLLLYDRAEQ